MTIGDTFGGLAGSAESNEVQDGSSLGGRVAAVWNRLDIASRFALTATAVVGLGMIVLVWWVSGRIEAGVVEHAGASVAVHSDSVVEPQLQALVQQPELPAEAKTNLQKLIAHSSQQPGGLLAISVWTPEGNVAFHYDIDANRAPDAFPGTSPRASSVRASYDADTSVPRLSVVLPMHDGASGRTIAVAKIEHDARHLSEQLAKVSAETALVTGLLSLMMIGVLFGIVRQASQTIAEQRKVLAERVNNLSELLEKNSQLQGKLLSVTRRSSETNDRALRRIGAELHDGPVQLIALSLLRLEGLRRFTRSGPEESGGEVDAIESALRDALTEMRGISAGLALPRLDGGNVTKAIEYAVMNHEKRSRTRVRLDIANDLPEKEDATVMACVYRFTQECLNNAARHAKGKGQLVRAHRSGDSLHVEVCDEGPGFTMSGQTSNGSGLGLIGLADRLHTLGGAIEVGNRPSGGARVAARLPLGTQRSEVADTPWGA